MQNEDNTTASPNYKITLVDECHEGFDTRLDCAEDDEQLQCSLAP